MGDEDKVMLSNAYEQLFQKYGRVFPAGTVLFKEGDATREIFILQSGRVRITKTVRDIEKLLDVLSEPGEFFGEMSFINNRPRIATAIVIEEARLLVIEPPVFEKMLLSSTEISFRFIRKLSARLDEADAQIANLLLRDDESRIVHYLVHLMEGTINGRMKIADGGILDIGAMYGWLGLRQDSARDVIEKLLKKGILTDAGEGRIAVTSMEILRKYMEFLEMKQKFGEY
jgi:CRP-like cAMP-binding protein